MSVLITTTAGHGHIAPMLPLAHALQARGHAVRWALPAGGVGRVEAAGIPAIAAGPPGPVHPNEVRARHPELDGLPAAEVPDFLYAKLFGGLVAPKLLADLEPVALADPPDLVVTDAAEFAGHLLAAELGVPAVTKGFGPLLPERRVARAGVEVAPLWRERGLAPRPYGGLYDHAYLDIYPPSLARPAAEVPHRWWLRPDNEDTGVGGGAGPLPLPPGSPGTPLVYVTMGTVFREGPLAPVVEALGALAVRVLVTVGPDGDPTSLGPQPRNVRVERYVPQSRLLPSCDLVVSHAGSGTAMAAARLGRPQLCLPQGADQFLNAEALAAAGAALALDPPDQTVGAIRSCVARLLADDAYRAAAARIGAEIEAMPPADAVVARLEELAGRPTPERAAR